MIKEQVKSGKMSVTDGINKLIAGDVFAPKSHTMRWLKNRLANPPKGKAK